LNAVFPGSGDMGAGGGFGIYASSFPYYGINGIAVFLAFLSSLIYKKKRERRSKDASQQ
jgi:hypothetical protein